MLSGIRDLEAGAVLTATERLVVAQRERAVEELLLVLRWADLHGDDPGEGRVPGADQLLPFGGEGTPLVRELVWAELAVARRAGVVATKWLAADALDLRHRLPLTWQTILELRLDSWVGRKVAAMSRALSKDAAAVVDAAVAAAADQAPGRILAIAEAKVIEADPDAHRAKITADAAKVGMRVPRPRPGAAIDTVDGQPATLNVNLKLPPGTALGFGEAVNQLADTIFDQLGPDDRDHITRGELQTQAINLLSNPAAATAFIDQANSGEDEPTAVPAAKRRPAILHVHISDRVLGGINRVDGVARVDGIGPMLLEQVADLLNGYEVTVLPVIDLNHGRSVNGYEHPTDVKQRTLLRTLGDVFPHSASRGSHRLDHDHPTPYDPPTSGGPPGQTGDHNDAPLTRGHHRTKTHHPGWQLRQLALGTYRWTTPHGLGRLVTGTGTRRFEPIRSDTGTVIGEIYYADPAPP